MLAVAGGILIVLAILAAAFFAFSEFEHGNNGCGCLILAVVIAAVLYILF